MMIANFVTRVAYAGFSVVGNAGESSWKISVARGSPLVPREVSGDGLPMNKP